MTITDSRGLADPRGMLRIDDLIDRQAAGEELDYLFFWGGPYSQWHDSPFKVKSFLHSHEMWECPTAEHYMMAYKAWLFNDYNTLERIVAASTPKEAKALGRQVKNFDEFVWEDHRARVVITATIRKFGLNDDLMQVMYEDRDKILVEASPYDQIWGIGMSKTHPDRLDPAKWKGKNLLGFCLMHARDTLVGLKEGTGEYPTKLF